MHIDIKKQIYGVDHADHMDTYLSVQIQLTARYKAVLDKYSLLLFCFWYRKKARTGFPSVPFNHCYAYVMLSQ